MVDPRWVIPVAAELVDMAAEADLVVVYEDGLLRGGVGSAVAEALHAAGVDTPLRQLAFPSVYPEHATRDEVLAEYGLDQESAASQVRQWALELADR